MKKRAAKPKRKRAGDHMHDVVRAWTRAEFEPGCGCQSTINDMNRGGVQWCKQNFDLIVTKLRNEASKRGWWKTFKQMPKAKLAVIIVTHPTFPFRPIRCMVDEAIRRSEADGKPTT
jgi:hypothetical protein